MAYYTFSFTNSNPDQVFSFNDMVDTSQNPILIGAVNHNDKSPEMQCWVGSDGKGRIELSGTATGELNKDITNNGFEFRY